jgi:conjugal transfer pilin signal peptidase TrbI
MKKFIIIAISIFVGAYITGHILISQTESLNYRVFWKSSIWADQSEKALKKGDYVLFEFAEDVYYVKRIGCLPSQHLRKLNGVWLCDNSKLKDGITITHSPSTGQKLKQFDFDGIIPEGKYFVIGDSQNSFDSRYWGFIDAENILYTLTPLW